MLELKRESMSVFIVNAREEIVGLWDDLLLGDGERKEFVAFYDGEYCVSLSLAQSTDAVHSSDEYTEELLTRHEEEITRLKEERRIKAPILASISKYFEICGDEQTLAVRFSRRSHFYPVLIHCMQLSAADQSRLLGRGPRDPGRLLREEKMRKRVKKEKPKVRSFLHSTRSTSDRAL